MKDLNKVLQVSNDVVSDLIYKIDNYEYRVIPNQNKIILCLLYLNENIVSIDKTNNDKKFSHEISDIIKNQFNELQIFRIWVIKYQPNSGTDFHSDNFNNRVIIPIKTNDRSILHYQTENGIEDWYLKLYHSYLIENGKHKFFNYHDTEDRVAIVFDYI